MTEYVFNTASNEGHNGGLHAARELVIAFVETLAELDSRLTGQSWPLKLPTNAWELQVSVDAAGEPVSLGEIVNDFYEDSQTRELAAFFDALQTYAPAAEQLGDAVVEAILRLEISGPAAGYEAVYQAIRDAGIEAMQCAVTDGALVSLGHQRWDFDRAIVACGDDEVSIDHASRVRHVDVIAQRRLEAVRGEVTRRNFEVIRERAFPSLRWGQDVVKQLQQFPPEYLALTFRRLAALDDMARRWKDSAAAQLDPGSLDLKGESDLTMQNYAEERSFRSESGEMRTYETHVWIDSGNRIHLLLDRELRTVEIGYVGPHLRTWKY